MMKTETTTEPETATDSPEVAGCAAMTCSRSIHKSRFGTFREATVGDWQCRRCGRVVKEESFERISKSIGYRWPLCACSTWKFENSDWRKLREKDIFSENAKEDIPDQK